ncbi:MAG: hypothetical protein HC843_11225 [Sphingomonadales bacterium]|nr:hypothetical protein [Sphingomonadales bacterium]
MDNILKMVVVILGLTGILAFIVPSAVPTDNKAEAPVNGEATPAGVKMDKDGNVIEAAQPAEPPQDAEEAIDDFDDFGAPMMDTSPINDLGGSAAASPQDTGASEAVNAEQQSVAATPIPQAARVPGTPAKKQDIQGGLSLTN